MEDKWAGSQEIMAVKYEQVLNLKYYTFEKTLWTV